MTTEKQWWINYYAEDIHKHLRCMEKKRFKFIGQSDLKLRSKVFSLLKKICKAKKYCTSALHLAAYMLEIFMDNHVMRQDCLEALVIICITLAVKLEEGDKLPPKFSDFRTHIPCGKPDLSMNQGFKLEIDILIFFNWSIMFPTTAHFIDYYLLFALLPNDMLSGKPLTCYKEVDTFVKKYIEYFMDVVLLDYNYLHYNPSLVASACIASVRRCMTIKPIWPDTLQNITLYTYEDLEPCVELLLKALDEDMIEEQKKKLKNNSGRPSKRKLVDIKEQKEKLENSPLIKPPARRKLKCDNRAKQSKSKLSCPESTVDNVVEN